LQELYSGLYWAGVAVKGSVKKNDTELYSGDFIDSIALLYFMYSAV
jgi:hypothetical protein